MTLLWSDHYVCNGHFHALPSVVGDPVHTSPLPRLGRLVAYYSPWDGSSYSSPSSFVTTLATIYTESLLLLCSFSGATLVVWKSGNALCDGTGFWVTILANESYLELQLAYLGWELVFWFQIVGNKACVGSKTTKTRSLLNHLLVGLQHILGFFKFGGYFLRLHDNPKHHIFFSVPRNIEHSIRTF